MIRAFALFATAVTSGFMLYIIIWHTRILSGQGWCAQAMGASNIGEGVKPEFAVSGCFSFMRRQIEALAINSHIAIGVIALCLAVLVVIVIAGGKLVFTAGRDGVSADIGKDVIRDGDDIQVNKE